MINEPVLDEIHRVRHAISAKINHDPHRIVAYFAELQQKHNEKIVDLSVSAGPLNPYRNRRR